jgi:predicted nuclease of predicted toxin-antitoxin system
MPRTIRFHLDEHCSHALADGLARYGIDVTTTPEAGLLHSPDEAQLAFAVASGRVIVTNDRDFLKSHAAGVSHLGILYCHQQKYSVGELIRLLVLVWEMYEPEEMRGRLEYL